MRDPTDSMPIDHLPTPIPPLAPDPTSGAPVEEPTLAPTAFAAPPDQADPLGQAAPTTLPFPPPTASAPFVAAPDSAFASAPYSTTGYQSYAGPSGAPSSVQPAQPAQSVPTVQRVLVRRRGAGWLATTLLALVMLVLGTALGVGLVKASPRTFSGLGIPGAQQSAPTATAGTHNQSLVGTPAPTVVVPPSATDLQQTIINVIHTVQPSVVEVQSVGPQGSAIGSGEIVSGDGSIVTNDHVVAGYQTYSVTLSDGQTYPAQLTGQDAADDLAVVKISAPTTLQPINFGESNKAQVGQFVLALGSPLGLQQSATFGIISALNRSASEAPNGPAGTLTGLIQTSAPINPGNSGGALVDLQGALIGVPTLGATDPNSGSGADGIGFAIPSDRVQFVATQLVKYGKVTNTNQGFLGIQGEDVTPQLASADNLSVQSGVLVTGFADDASGKSPAQTAGVKIGDIITGVNGQTVNVNADLATILFGDTPGTQVTVQLVRGTTQLTVTITLGERPANLNG